MRNARRWLCLLLAALLCASAAGCGEKQEPDGESLALRACVCAPLISLDPATNTQKGSEHVFCALFENLMTLREDEEGGVSVELGAAKEYTVSEEFDGSVTYRFTLRSSARWSDGERLRAGDFVFAWRRLVDPETASPYHALLSVLSGYEEARETGDTSKLGIKAENDRTLTVTLREPCAWFLSEVCTAVATMPLRRDVVTGDPRHWAADPNFVGNGAFCVAAWQRGEYLELTRNASYHDSRLVRPDTLRFVFAASPEKAWTLYEDGGADFLALLPDDAAARLTEGEAALASVPVRGVCCVVYNEMSTVFVRRVMRQAFDLSIDRAALAEATGMEAANGFVSPGVPDGAEEGLDFRTAGGTLCQTDAEGYLARCGSAVDLLAAAGYLSVGDLPSVELIFPGEEPFVTMAIALQEMWQTKLGVTVMLAGLSRAEYDSRIADGTYDLALREQTAGSGDAMAFLSQYAVDSEQNVAHYWNSTYDLLLAVAEASKDSEARAAFLHDAETLLLEDAALSPLCFSARRELLRAGYDGVAHDMLGRCDFTGVTFAES